MANEGTATTSASGAAEGSEAKKKIAGKYSPEQWNKMDARARLAAANGQDPNAALGF